MSEPVDPVDEGRHVPDADTAWTEALRLDVIGVSGGPGTVEQRCLGLVTQVTIGVAGGRGRVEFLAVVLEEGRRTVVLSETEIDVPATRWELRGSGIWADHVVEDPLRRWSYGLEAFALAVDSPDQLLEEAVGVRVPLGWELDVSALSPPAVIAPFAGGTDAWTGYGQDGEVEGLLLGGDIGTESRAVRGLGRRSHWWGTGGPARFDLVAERRPRPLVAVGTNSLSAAIRYRLDGRVRETLLADGRLLSVTGSAGLA